MHRSPSVLLAPVVAAALLGACSSSSTAGSTTLPSALPTTMAAAPTTGAPSTPVTPVTPTGDAPTSAATTPDAPAAPTATAAASPSFPDLVADPKLVWAQPPGLTGAQQAAVDAYHRYWQRYAAAASTGNASYAPLYEIATGNVAQFAQRSLGALTHGATGTLSVRVESATAGSATAVSIRACVDQTVLYAKDAKGKAVIMHSADDTVTSTAGMSLSPTKGWQYLVSGASTTGCA